MPLLEDLQTLIARHAARPDLARLLPNVRLMTACTPTDLRYM